MANDKSSKDSGAQSNRLFYFVGFPLKVVFAIVVGVGLIMLCGFLFHVANMTDFWIWDILLGLAGIGCVIGMCFSCGKLIFNEDFTKAFEIFSLVLAIFVMIVCWLGGSLMMTKIVISQYVGETFGSLFVKFIFAPILTLMETFG